MYMINWFKGLRATINLQLGNDKLAKFKETWGELSIQKEVNDLSKSKNLNYKP